MTTASWSPTLNRFRIGPLSHAAQWASTGTPSNRSQLGITALTLQQVPGALPPTASQVAPSIGGLKATQIWSELTAR